MGHKSNVLINSFFCNIRQVLASHALVDLRCPMGHPLIRSKVKLLQNGLGQCKKGSNGENPIEIHA